jgi:hypothetical protein
VRLQSIGINRVLLVFVSVSVFVGLGIGYTANLDAASFFRGVVLANVVLAGYLVLVRNIIGGIIIYLYALVLFNYYWRIVTPGLLPDLDMPRLMFLFVWLLFLLEVLFGRRRLLPGGVIGVLMLLVMTAFALSMLTLGKPVVRNLLNGFVVPYAMFALCKNVFTDKRWVDRFIFWLSVPLALYFPATSILEHYRVYSLIFPRYISTVTLGTGEVAANWGGRSMGTFIQPAVTGCAMVMIFFIALYSLSRRKGAFAKLYSVLLFLITPVGVFFTYTRSAYLGFVGGLIIIVLFMRKIRLPVFLLLVAMGLAVMGNWTNIKTADRESGGVGDVETAQARMVILSASVRMFMDRPVFGCGAGRFMEEAEPYVQQVTRTVLGYREIGMGLATNQHNQFSGILAETGLVGFVPFVLLYVFLIRLLGKARSVRAEEYDSEFVVLVWAVLWAYVSVIMFIEPRWFEFMNALPFMFMGIVAGGYERATLRKRSGVPGNAGLARKGYAE